MLKLRSVETIGYIHLLYAFAAQYTEGGDLKKYTPEEIEAFCEWQGATLRLFNALLATNFLDKKSNGEFKVHGFYEANTAHLKDIARKRKERKIQGQGEDKHRTVLATNERTNEQTDVHTAFVPFWDSYPARQGRKEGKSEASAEWTKLNPNEALVEKIMKAVKSIENEQYPVNAAKWLQQKRWLDEKVVLDQSHLPPHLRVRAV